MTVKELKEALDKLPVDGEIEIKENELQLIVGRRTVVIPVKQDA